jgi:hypothetical protein
MVDDAIRSALFVDFDNVYIGLRELDQNAAERFAADPGRWLAWIEAGMPGPVDTDSASIRDRKVLIRRCYLNPVAFARYRPFFIRTGFSVIDCPPLTSQGKTSTDIHMVMDILDTLAQYEHIAEFIVLSGDADFTPVLLRLRSRDKRTTSLTVGPAAAAYRAASDRILTENDFVEVGLGADADRNGWPAPNASTRAEPVPVRTRPEAVPADLPALREAMLAEVRRGVAASSRPVALARAAHWLHERFGERVEETDWAGAGSFKALLLNAGNLGFEVTGGAPGYIVDPARHELTEQMARSEPQIDGLVLRISNITGAPALTPHQYRRLFEALSEELARQPYQLTTTSKAVRDRCAALDDPIPRHAINFVLKGVAYRQGFQAGAPTDPRALAAAFAENVLGLAGAAQLELSGEERAQVLAWIGADEGSGAQGGSGDPEEGSWSPPSPEPAPASGAQEVVPAVDEL